MKVMSLPFSLFMWNILDEAYLKFQWKFLARDWREKKILAREHEQQQQQQVVIIRRWRQIQTKNLTKYFISYYQHVSTKCVEKKLRPALTTKQTFQKIQFNIMYGSLVLKKIKI